VLLLPSRLAGRLQHTPAKKSSKAVCVQPAQRLLSELWIEVVNLDTILLDPGVLMLAGGAAAAAGMMSGGGAMTPTAAAAVGASSRGVGFMQQQQQQFGDKDNSAGPASGVLGPTGGY
jgi:hypothetical protein